MSGGILSADHLVGTLINTIKKKPPEASVLFSRLMHEAVCGGNKKRSFPPFSCRWHQSKKVLFSSLYLEISAIHLQHIINLKKKKEISLVIDFSCPAGECYPAAPCSQRFFLWCLEWSHYFKQGYNNTISQLHKQDNVMKKQMEA